MQKYTPLIPPDLFNKELEFLRKCTPLIPPDLFNKELEFLRPSRAIPPTGLLKIQDDEIEGLRWSAPGVVRHLSRELARLGLVTPLRDMAQYLEGEARRLRSVLKNLTKEIPEQRTQDRLIPYELPPDYYPDEQTAKQHLAEHQAYMRRQEERYLKAGFVFEKGRATWDSRMFEAFVLAQIARPRRSLEEIAAILHVTKQRVSQMVHGAAELLAKEELLPPLPPRKKPRKSR